MENVNQFFRNREDSYFYKGLELPINANEEYKCIPVLIERLADEFLASLQLHSKVLVVRVDIHTNEQDLKNKSIEDLLRWLKQDLRRNYRMRNIGHLWVREDGIKKRKHWHLVLLLDGNKVQDSRSVINKMKSYWENTNDYGLIKPPQNPYIQIKRGDSNAFNAAFYRASYLTKERSKFVGPERSYGCSRLTCKML